MTDTQYIGKAGEYRVLSELVLRDFNPAVKSIDDGVDIVLDNNKTIQVKTISKPNDKRQNNYTFTLTNVSYQRGKRKNKYNNLKADFLIVWLIDIDAFYIIPKKLASIQLSIALGAKRSKYNYCLNNWKILREEA